MERLLTVTSGYLKFAFVCMIGGAGIFSLAALAIARPPTFRIVTMIVVPISLLIWTEVIHRRRALELDRAARANPEQSMQSSLSELFEFGGTAGLLMSSLQDAREIPATELLITELAPGYLHDAPTAFDKEGIARAAFVLRQHEEDLAHNGYYAILISPESAPDIINSIRRRSITSPTVAKPVHSVSIAFLADRRKYSRMSLKEILEPSFRILRVEVIALPGTRSKR